jgi:hypothetical protein
VSGPPRTKPAVNWWELWHKAMTELQWTPEEIGRLTPTQLMALGSKKDPRVVTYDASNMGEFIARVKADRAVWEKP